MKEREREREREIVRERLTTFGILLHDFLSYSYFTGATSNTASFLTLFGYFSAVIIPTRPPKL